MEVWYLYGKTGYFRKLVSHFVVTNIIKLKKKLYLIGDTTEVLVHKVGLHFLVLRDGRSDAKLN